MKYLVIWYNQETKTRGQPFYVEGGDLNVASLRAEWEIKAMSPFLGKHFTRLDLEQLIEEGGKPHEPEIYITTD